MSEFASEKAIKIVKEAEKQVEYKFKEIDEICEYNQLRFYQQCKNIDWLYVTLMKVRGMVMMMKEEK